MILQGILLVVGGILALLVFLIVFLTLVPPTILFEYVEAGFLIELHVLFLKFPLLRRESQEAKEKRLAKKERKASKKKKKDAKEKTDGEKEKKKTDYPSILKLVYRVLEEFSRKGPIPLNHLWLDVTIGGENPATTGMLFGGTHGILGALWPLVERFFYVKDRQIRTAIDFTISAPRVEYFYALLPLPLGKVLRVAVVVLLGHIKERGMSQQVASKEESNEQREAA